MARGLKPTLVLFAVQIAAMLFVSATPFLPGEQQLFTQLLKLMEVQITGLPPSLLVLYVFGHNLVVAALESVPLLGPLVFAASTCVTAKGIEVLAVMRGVSGPLLVVDVLLLPHSWLELPAYALTGVEGYFLSQIVTHPSRRFRTEMAPAAFVLLLAAALLAVAAAFEVSEEQLGFPNEYFMWIPFAALAAGAYLAFSKIRGLGGHPAGQQA